MLCKTCHDEFDPEVTLQNALADARDDVFWVSIFANDIGAPPKHGSDKKYHLTAEAVREMSVKNIPVRYFHCSDPIGRVLFGWHIHWADRPTFACACLATIDSASFQAGAPVLLTVACQSSLGTVTGVPDEISITQLGARDDTVGVFCRRKTLRDVLTRFRFFSENVAEPIKRNCTRASKLCGSSMSGESPSDTPASTAVDAQGNGSTVEVPIDENEDEDEGKMAEIESIAKQVGAIQAQLNDQSQALNITRGILEEYAVKSLAELKASEASGAKKVRKDVERMIREGVIRQPDDPNQPKVGDAYAVQELVNYNMGNFQNALNESFVDAVNNILSPLTPPSSSTESDASSPNVCGIGNSLNAVRASAYRVITTRGNTSSDLQVAPVRSAPLQKKRQPSSLQKIHEVLAKRMDPTRKRQRFPDSMPRGYDRENTDHDEDVNYNKIRKMIQGTIQEEMERWAPRREFTLDRDERRDLFKGFCDFYEQRRREQEQSQSVPVVTPNAGPTQVPVSSIPQSSNPHQQPPTVVSPAQPVPTEGDVVRASGVSLPREKRTLKDLGIFY